jgi:hypothetical protein
LNESDPKKLISQFRQCSACLVDQHPLIKTGLKPYHNLLYLVLKEQKLEGEDILNDLKTQLKSNDAEQRLASVKLLRERLTFLENK